MSGPWTYDTFSRCVRDSAGSIVLDVEDGFLLSDLSETQEDALGEWIAQHGPTAIAGPEAAR